MRADRSQSLPCHSLHQTRPATATVAEPPLRRRSDVDSNQIVIGRTLDRIPLLGEDTNVTDSERNPVRAVAKNRPCAGDTPKKAPFPRLDSLKIQLPKTPPRPGWAIPPQPVHAVDRYLGNPDDGYEEDAYANYVPPHYTSGESLKAWYDHPIPHGTIDSRLPPAATYDILDEPRTLLSPPTQNYPQEIKYDHYTTAATNEHDVSPVEYAAYGNAYLPSPDDVSDGSPLVYVKQEEDYDAPVVYLSQEEPEHRYLSPPDTESDSDGEGGFDEEDDYKPKGLAHRKPKAKKTKGTLKKQHLYGHAAPLAKPPAKARLSSSKGENSPHRPEVSLSGSAAPSSPVKRGSPSTSPLTSRHAAVARRQPSMEAGKRFIEKIFHFLQDPSKYDNLIRWDDSETVVLIAHKDPAFPKMLESHFSHKNFSAFARQFAVYNCQAQTKRAIRLLTLNGQSLDGKLRDEYRGWKHKSGEFCGKTLVQDLPFFVATPSRARREAKEKRELVHKKRLASWTAPMKGDSVEVEVPMQMQMPTPTPMPMPMQRQRQMKEDEEVESEPEGGDDDLMSEEDVLGGPEY